ncbi:TPA: virulence RhuM family protein [Legionella pneumophila]|nr:virulence RhuM family protein [Legionella pneumophila]HAT6937498.1 virulence factor [Legionella pneumophila]HAU1656917.1 virulence RhuM family protein [Legionella pneumophila]
MSEIVIYTAKDGHIELDVNLANETVWLTLNQISQLFQRDKSVISRHLNNIFKSNELEPEATVAKFATVQKEGSREIERTIEYYNLDAIISIGYRVNSKEGVQFRKWASNILKEHLIRGYTTNEKRLNQQGIHELQQTVELLQKTLINHDLVNDLGRETIQIILAYSKTWDLLLAYV